MKQKLPILIIILLLLTSSSVGLGLAQGPGPLPTPSVDEVNRIAKNLYCPVCENIPLDVCESDACAQWRELIREKLIEGLSEEEIYDFFVVQYGDRVLAEPPRKGLNWLVYIVPPIALLAGAFILFNLIRNSPAPLVQSGDEATSKVETDSTPEDDKYASLLEDELKKRE